eukprot:926713-Alexandrium_andersonii.AAC.1
MEDVARLARSTREKSRQIELQKTQEQPVCIIRAERRWLSRSLGRGSAAQEQNDWRSAETLN